MVHTVCGSRNIIPYLPQGRSCLEIPGRGWGPSQKPKFLKESIYEAKLEFLEGWRGSIPKNLLQGWGGVGV